MLYKFKGYLMSNLAVQKKIKSLKKLNLLYYIKIVNTHKFKYSCRKNYNFFFKTYFYLNNVYTILYKFINLFCKNFDFSKNFFYKFTFMFNHQNFFKNSYEIYMNLVRILYIMKNIDIYNLKLFFLNVNKKNLMYKYTTSSVNFRTNYITKNYLFKCYIF